MSDILTQEEVTALLSAVAAGDLWDENVGDHKTKKERSMGVIVEKDCVKKPDGTLICYDKEDKCYYLLKKTMVKPSEIDDADILAISEKLARGD